MKLYLLIVCIGLLGVCWTKDSLRISPCDQERDKGSCQLYVEKYFYNSTDRECQKFSYGGCGGNENRFESKFDCEESCNSPPIDENGDDIAEENEDEEIDETSKTPRQSLLGNLFQKSLLTSFDWMKPDPFFDVYEPDVPSDEDESNLDGDEPGDEEEEEEEEEDVELRNPFANIFDILRPRSRSIFNPFSTPRLTGNPFGRPFWSKSMDRLRKKIDKSFERMTNVFERKAYPIECDVCKQIVKLVDYQITTLKKTLEEIVEMAKSFCKLYPPATKSCDAIIKKLKDVIDKLEQGLTPKEICINLELCQKATLPDGFRQSITISYRRECAPICNFMKAIHDEKAVKIYESWKATKQQLKRFCNDNKIIKKCDLLFKMFDKSFTQLSGITEKQKGESCKCFKDQPLFETKRFDSCFRCQQFKKGMANEVEGVNKSIMALATRVKELCALFPSQQCTDVVSSLRSSLEYNTVYMPDICNVTGYCENTAKNDSFVSLFKKPFSAIGDLFPKPKPIMWKMLGMNLKRFTPDCMFCKKCMGDLKETFEKVNATIPVNGTEATDSTKDIYPAVKEGFNLYCQTRTTGGNYTTVCRKIADGIETVHKVITARDKNEEGMCKTLGVC